jgi:RecB family exonuclease
MTVYSHSKLNTYEQCPLKYRFIYLDKLKRPTEESIEAFLGNRVHDTLQKCYEDIKCTKLDSLSDLLEFFNRIWNVKWHDSVLIVRPDVTREHYRALGEKLIENYHKRYSPFDQDITIGTEIRLNFALDNAKKYKMTGFVDRLSRTVDNVYEIHDYKTSAHLVDQQEIDADRQLGLYHFAVKQKWPDAQNIRLIWHYLAFDTDLVSYRTLDAISDLTNNTIELIDQIESAQDFPANETRLCEWCEYQQFCPHRKHFHKVESLPANEYSNEPGVVLVNKYSELKAKAEAIDIDIHKVRDALINYARRENLEVIKGDDRKARIKFEHKLKFPGKNDIERKELDDILLKAGKWAEVSQLDTLSLGRVIEDKQWSPELIDQVMKYGRVEETSSVYLLKLKKEE